MSIDDVRYKGLLKFQKEFIFSSVFRNPHNSDGGIVEDRVNVEIKIRDAVLSDMEQISAIEKASFSDAWSDNLLRSELLFGNGVFVVAEINGLVVAYAIAQDIASEFHILSIAVLQDFKRLSIGSMLVDVIVQYAKEHKMIGVTLECRVSNEAAVGLYQKMGFSLSGTRKAYYDDGEDAYIMWKRFKETTDQRESFHVRSFSEVKLHNEAKAGEEISINKGDGVTSDKEMNERNNNLEVKKSEKITLAIETSCDETSCAILRGSREILANEVYSQIDVHKLYGGVVPEIASRNHLMKIADITDSAIKTAGITYDDIDLVAVTRGPGLVGALLVGVTFTKALAYSLNKRFIGIHHIEGHIAANYIASKELKPPFLCLVVSGGHTHLVDVRGYTEFKVIGRTKDDAVGEAYDKVARVLGLGYPGGPPIDRLAKEGQATISFPKAKMDELDFSFSGLKTAVLNYINSAKQRGEELNIPDICASFQEAVVSALYEKTKKALEQTGYTQFALAGGVAANSRIREALHFDGVTSYYPPISLCTDNAAMIAAAAYQYDEEGYHSPMSINASPTIKIGESFSEEEKPIV